MKIIVQLFSPQSESFLKMQVRIHSHKSIFRCHKCGANAPGAIETAPTPAGVFMIRGASIAVGATVLKETGNRQRIYFTGWKILLTKRGYNNSKGGLE
ncbi:MAG TPA: hypothetical protein DCZ10_06520 [Pelotomaculum sp.]|nr:hypothetical protein [Pelotomaculum sp.]